MQHNAREEWNQVGEKSNERYMEKEDAEKEFQCRDRYVGGPGPDPEDQKSKEDEHIAADRHVENDGE